VVCFGRLKDVLPYNKNQLCVYNLLIVPSLIFIKKISLLLEIKTLNIYVYFKQGRTYNNIIFVEVSNYKDRAKKGWVTNLEL
jgi:hypothetical protein